MGEVVDLMERLYVDNRKTIQNQDESDPAYIKYRECIKSINEYFDHLSNMARIEPRRSIGDIIYGPGLKGR